MRPTWDTYFLLQATLAATRSTCPRLHVGCVLVLESKVIGTGYNGAPSHMPHCDDVGCDIQNNHCERTIHAEINALLNAVTDVRYAVAYITHSPCYSCFKQLYQAGIRQFFYGGEYNPDPRINAVIASEGLYASVQRLSTDMQPVLMSLLEALQTAPPRAAETPSDQSS